ncbi:hypothetical protein ANCDUO_09127 [Ancylostoma duodenale]|uniref:Uncharacterized protein n=1 Tax=Ancylostoma duodenale TaxID=51022 RepID=A0A0C2DDS1_9BILA|nr:hypothetical protein ANCDUO_09127 [Ancylostoma duodenale]
MDKIKYSCCGRYYYKCKRAIRERYLRKQSSLLSVMGVTSMQEILLTINSLDSLSDAMRRAGLENTNMIFGKRQSVVHTFADAFRP